MAYLVLARKYRPQSFADMVGQEHVTRTLANAIAHDRVHHAYLFCGVRGLGKTTAARILAKCLVCEEGPTPTPCGTCAQCEAVATGNSVDVVEIDGASNNSVDDVRSLREKVHYLPQSARRKIYIIDEVHMLTASAFNALLKTLEEPPPHVTFLFATTDPHKVLPTIMSRVSRLDFRPASDATLTAHLKHILACENVMVEDDGLEILARCAENSIRDSLTLLDKVIAFADQPEHITTSEVRTILGQADRFMVAELVAAVFKRDAQATLTRFASLCEQAHNLPRLAVAILQHFRDLAVLKACGDAEVLLSMGESLRTCLRAQAQSVETITVSQHFDRFSHTVDRLDDSRAPRLALEMGLLDLVYAEPLTPIGELIDELRAGGQSASNAPATDASPSNSTPSNNATSELAPAESPLSRVATTGGSETVASTTSTSGPVAPTAFSPTASTPTAEPTPAPDTATPPADPELTNELWNMLNPPAPNGASPESDEAGNAPPLTPTTRPSPATSTKPRTIAVVDDTEHRVPPPAVPNGDPPRGPTRDRLDWRELEPIRAWEAFLGRVQNEDAMLYAILVELGLAQLETGHLRLACPCESFTRQQLRPGSDASARLQELLSRHLGGAFELSWVDTAASQAQLPSVAQLQHRREADHRARLYTEARQHPQLVALLHAFSGTLEKVEPTSSRPNAGELAPTA
ncbi:MAG: DNA polymerase III subunit gamma/tau [Nannocystaceae bacterium]